MRLLSEYAWEEGCDWLYQPNGSPVFPLHLYTKLEDAEREKRIRTDSTVEDICYLADYHEGCIEALDPDPQLTFKFVAECASDGVTFAQWKRENYPLPDSEHRSESLRIHLQYLFKDVFYDITEIKVD